MSFDGQVVELTISDPWDFVSHRGAGPFVGHVVTSSSGKLAVLLSDALRGDDSIAGAVVSARYAHAAFDTLCCGKATPCNIVFCHVPLDSQFDPSSWRPMYPTVGSIVAREPMEHDE